MQGRAPASRIGIRIAKQAQIGARGPIPDWPPFTPKVEHMWQDLGKKTKIKPEDERKCAFKQRPNGFLLGRVFVRDGLIPNGFECFQI